MPLKLLAVVFNIFVYSVIIFTVVDVVMVLYYIHVIVVL